jgi:hypothetical protein
MVEATSLFVIEGVITNETSDGGDEVTDTGLTELTTLIQIAELASIVPNITTPRAAILFLFTVLFTIA